MRAAIATVGVNVALTVAIVTPLWLNGVAGAHAGIALATAIAGVVNAALLWRFLRRQKLYSPQAGWARHLLRLLLACVAMTLVVLALRRYIGSFGVLDEYTRWMWLAVMVASGALAYGLALLAAGWRPRELRHR
jgi:putative peptidoglycan lipid II flippase